jgi:hypothetical protein
MPDLRRVGVVLGEAARSTVRTLLGLVFIAVIVIQSPFIFRRQRRRYRNLGKRLGLTEGDVLSSTFIGGALTTSELKVVSLRSGAWPDVVALVTGRVGQEGYRLRKQMPQSGPPPREMYYRPPRSKQMPPLLLSVYESGEVIEWTEFVVPAGKTGLRFHLA